jgi:hypothetical protein
MIFRLEIGIRWYVGGLGGLGGSVDPGGFLRYLGLTEG